MPICPTCQERERLEHKSSPGYYSECHECKKRRQRELAARKRRARGAPQRRLGHGLCPDCGERPRHVGKSGKRHIYCAECMRRQSRERYHAKRGQTPEPGAELAELRYEPTPEGLDAAPGELRYELPDLGRAALAVHAGGVQSAPPPASPGPTLAPVAAAAPPRGRAAKQRGRKALALVTTGHLLERRAARLAAANQAGDLAAMREAALDVVDMARVMVLIAEG